MFLNVVIGKPLVDPKTLLTLDDLEFPRDLEAGLNMQMAATVIDFLNLHNLNANKLCVTNIERIENDL